MADFTIHAAAAVAGGVAASAVASVFPGWSTLFSFEPHSFIAALFGAGIGAGMATPDSRLRGMGVSLCVAVTSAIIGPAIAEYFIGQSRLASDGVAAVIAILFHPLLNSVVGLMPRLIEGVSQLLTRGRG